MSEIQVAVLNWRRPFNTDPAISICPMLYQQHAVHQFYRHKNNATTRTVNLQFPIPGSGHTESYWSDNDRSCHFGWKDSKNRDYLHQIHQILIQPPRTINSVILGCLFCRSSLIATLPHVLIPSINNIGARIPHLHAIRFFFSDVKRRPSVWNNLSTRTSCRSVIVAAIICEVCLIRNLTSKNILSLKDCVSSSSCDNLLNVVVIRHTKPLANFIRALPLAGEGNLWWLPSSDLVMGTNLAVHDGISPNTTLTRLCSLKQVMDPWKRHMDRWRTSLLWNVLWALQEFATSKQNQSMSGRAQVLRCHRRTTQRQRVKSGQYKLSSRMAHNSTENTVGFMQGINLGM